MPQDKLRNDWNTHGATFPSLNTEYFKKIWTTKARSREESFKSFERPCILCTCISTLTVFYPACLWMALSSGLKCITFHECSYSPQFAVQGHWSSFERVLLLNVGPFSTQNVLRVLCCSINVAEIARLFYQWRKFQRSLTDGNTGGIDFTLSPAQMQRSCFLTGYKILNNIFRSSSPNTSNPVCPI